MHRKPKSSYLEKRAVYDRLIPVSKGRRPHMIVVIPCHNEPDLKSTLHSLMDCDSPKNHIEIIVVINHHNLADRKVIQQNDKTLEVIERFIHSGKDKYPVFPLYIKDLNDKYAGVGMARKIGMDEACRRLDDDGIIICLDGDCTVSPDYFTRIEQHFALNPTANGCSIYYEHPTAGQLDQRIYAAIIKYELHLRYYIHIQRICSLPYAYQTVGSSMAVVNKSYKEVGGMNKRKAGEDFYFIHKLIKQGRFSECNTTTVFPSPRVSDRVPFGTGRAMTQMLSKEALSFLTYDPESFRIVKAFVDCFASKKDYQFIPVEIRGFISNELYDKKIREIESNTTSDRSFLRRFFNWFDAFYLMKMLHHLRDHYFPPMDIIQAVEIIDPAIRNMSHLEQLLFYRNRDKHSSYKFDYGGLKVEL
jgi:glycosyltransferase involved in cell wall biosynthesis